MYRPYYLPEYSALYLATGAISSESVFSGARNVFVCGALQDPARMSALLGLEPPFAPAAVTGYRRTIECIDGRDVPFMVSDRDDPRSVLTGVVWLDLSREAFDRIESRELEGGLRTRTAVGARIGEVEFTAHTYVKK